VPEPWRLGADGLGGYGKELTLNEPVLTLYFFSGKIDKKVRHYEEAGRPLKNAQFYSSSSRRSRTLSGRRRKF